MTKHRFRIAAAIAGASAAVVMGALSATEAQAAQVVPQHFGGPVNTTIYRPTATLSMPTLSSSSAGTPTPMNAPG